MVQPVERDARGILDPLTARSVFDLRRCSPGPATASCVDRYWYVSWDLPDGRVHHQQVLSHPVVNVVFERDGATVSGVLHERTTRRLAGCDRALGVMFRPGGFAPFLDGPVSRLTDMQLPIEQVLGAKAATLADRVAQLLDAAAPLEALVAPVEAHFAASDPERVDAGLVEALERAAVDRSLVRVNQLAELAGLSVRQLQRRCAAAVGVPPKWLIRRYRIADAAEAVAHGQRVRWADLAADLGYSDQSHLVREFTSAFGVPPAQYARLCGEASSPSPIGGDRASG